MASKVAHKLSLHYSCDPEAGELMLPWLEIGFSAYHVESWTRRYARGLSGVSRKILPLIHVEIAQQGQH